MRKLSPRDVKEFGQSHRARKWQSGSRLLFITSKLHYLHHHSHLYPQACMFTHPPKVGARSNQDLDLLKDPQDTRLAGPGGKQLNLSQVQEGQDFKTGLT